MKTMVDPKWNILIDFDGTLHDTTSIFAEKLNGLFGLNGKELFRTYLEDIHRRIVHKEYPEKHDDMNLHWRLLLQYLGEPDNRENREVLTRRFEEANMALLETPSFFPEVPAFLKHLVSNGHQICLSTGGGNSVKKAETLNRYVGTNYFTEVLGEEIVGKLKHEPAYYRETLKRLVWKPRDTVSIGDTILTDIYPANVVGIHTIWINRREQKAPTEAARKPENEATNLTVALNFL